MAGPDMDCTLENPTKEWVPKVQSALRESLRRKDRAGVSFFWCENVLTGESIHLSFFLPEGAFWMFVRIFRAEVIKE